MWGEERCIQGFGRKTGEKDYLENPGVNGRTILRWTFSKWDVGSMEWIELAQDRDWGRALVTAVRNLRVP